MASDAEKPIQKRTSDVEILENVKFSEIGLSTELVKSLAKNGFISPSPIQLRALPLACSGLDILVQAKSGTGKTLIFAAVVLEKFDLSLKSAQSLIVVPTREIAVQIVSVLNAVGKAYKNFRAESFIGGLDISDDRKKMAAARCVVATPGRCLHLLQNKVLNTTDIGLLVLDEADSLVTNDSMKADVMKIYSELREKKQVIAASATYDKACEKVLCRLMKNPVGVTPRREIPVLKGVKQFALTIADQPDNIKEMFTKVEEMKRIFGTVQFKQCMVFANSQMRAESYSVYLNKANHTSEVISGGQDQKKRLQVLEKLRAFECRILLATDLMARGIDVENINLIVNLEVPYDAATYLHRIGRAGRYGSYGIAITILQAAEVDKFRKLLGDIGGESMSVLKFPNEEVLSDQLWSFEDPEADKQKYGEIFGILTAAAPQTDKEAEVVAKNMELLKVSLALVDQTTEPMMVGAELFEDYENFKANTEGKPQMTKEETEEGKDLNSSGDNTTLDVKSFEGEEQEPVQNETAVVDLFDDYAQFKASVEEATIQTENLNTELPAAEEEVDPAELFDDYASYKASMVEISDSKTDASAAECMIKPMEMNSLLTVIKNFMSELESKKVFTKPVAQPPVQNLPPKAIPSIEKQAPTPPESLDATALYEDYFKMKNDLKLVCADQGSVNGHYVDTPIREAAIKAKQAESQSMFVGSSFTSSDPNISSDYDTITDFFEDYARLRRKLKAATEQGATKLDAEQSMNVDGRNDQQFLKAVQTNTTQAPKETGQDAENSIVTIDSTASTIGSECNDRLDDLETSLCQNAVIFTRDNNSDSESSCSSELYPNEVDHNLSDSDDDSGEDEGEVMDLNETYRQSHTMWTNIFWNQTTQIMDYVKYSRHIQSNSGELIN